MYGDRINELDLRVAKVFRRGGLRTLVAVDLYNALNSSAALSSIRRSSQVAPGPNRLQSRRPG